MFKIGEKVEFYSKIGHVHSIKDGKIYVNDEKGDFWYFSVDNSFELKHYIEKTNSEPSVNIPTSLLMEIYATLSKGSFESTALSRQLLENIKNKKE